MRVVTLKYPVTMQQHCTWSGMDQRQHGELVTLVLKLYGCIRCPGEGSSSRINLLLRWQLTAQLKDSEPIARSIESVSNVVYVHSNSCGVHG